MGGLGQGLAMKLVNNMLIQVNMVAVAEALVLGVKAGLDPRTIYEASDAGARSGRGSFTSGRPRERSSRASGGGCTMAVSCPLAR